MQWKRMRRLSGSGRNKMTSAPNDRFPVFASAVGAGRRVERVADWFRAREPLGVPAMDVAPAEYQHECIAFLRRCRNAIGHGALWVGRCPHGGQRME